MLFCNIDILDENLEHKTGMFVGTEGDTIAYVGMDDPRITNPELAKRFGDVYDGTGKLLMSAFYNTHAHTPMTLLRGYAENQPLQQWLNDTVWPFEAKIDAYRRDHYWGCLLAEAEMIRYGVISYTDMYFGTIDRCKATLDAGMKANHTDGGTMCFVEKDYDTLPVAAVNRQLFEEYDGAGDGRVKIDMCIHGEYTTPEGMVRRVAEEAQKHHANVHLHLSETKSEHEECKQRHNGMTPAAWFEHCGVFDNPTTAAHCVWVDDDDIAILAKHGVSVSLNPASNMKLASGFAPVQKMIDGGVNCTIGTDGMASNNTHNILQSAYLLACSQKGNALDPTVIAPIDLLRMLTVNGAKAQGRPDCGVLAEGKKADLVVFDIDTPWMKPVYDFAVNLIYSANGADVVLTMCDGKVLYQDGDFKTIDVEKAASEVEWRVKDILAALDGDKKAE